jgi:RNA polymerase sigma factor (sigma-70 family)
MSKPSRRFDVIGHLGSLRRYACSLTRDSADAEDLVHDALVRAYERRSTYRQGGNLRAWLLSIVHNVFVDRIRSRTAAAAREVAIGNWLDANVEPSQDHVVRLAQIRNAFFHLPQEQRAALHLVAIEGLSYQEAADTLGVSLGTLMSRIGRARARLRSLEDTASRAMASHLRIVGGRYD